MTESRAPLTSNVAITLNAVLAAVDGNRPKVLCVERADGFALPYGPFDPTRHRTFEIGVREWVEKQTNLSLGYVEQLYTFGDKGREAPLAAFENTDNGERIVSVGYLALAAEPAPVETPNAGWRDWYSFFPWEDWRKGEPEIVASYILPALEKWSAQHASKKEARRSRIAASFATNDGDIWDDARTLDRYELMYEAGIVEEAWRDRQTASLALPDESAPAVFETGTAMISDHRRILATAIGRLRGKLRYRPVLFEMAPVQFTLLQLQQLIEAIVGYSFHKQNFRRSIEKSGFVSRTEKTTQIAGGRPAAIFVLNRQRLREDATTGISIPRLQR